MLEIDDDTEGGGFRVESWTPGRFGLFCGRESLNAELLLLLDMMSEGAAALDAAGRVRYCNRTFAALIGVGPEHIEGWALEQLLTPSSRRALREALSSPDQATLLVSLQSPGGEARTTQLTMRKLGGQGVQAGSLVVIESAAEERCRELRGALAEATAEREASARRFWNMLHELRTPLSVVMGWTAHLLERKSAFDARTQRALDAMDRNARLQLKRMQEIADRMDNPAR